MLGRLYVLYHETNEREFAGMLPMLPIHVEHMQAKKGKRGQVGDMVPHPFTGAPSYIRMHKEFVLAGHWSDVSEILKHEMVHVWQAVQGHHDNHGASFKRMAKRLNIPEKACS